MEVPGFLDTCWGGGWLCAVDAAEGFPCSPLGWPTGKSAHETSSHVSFQALCSSWHTDLGMHGHVCISLVSFSREEGSVCQLSTTDETQWCICSALLLSTSPLPLPLHSHIWQYPFSPLAWPLQRTLLRVLLEVLSDVGTCFQAWQAIPHSYRNAGMPLEPPLVGRVMLMGTCSGSTWRRAGAGSRAGPFLEAAFITAETSFDSCTTNKHANKPASPSDITRAEQYNYRAQVSSISLILALWRPLKPSNALHPFAGCSEFPKHCRGVYSVQQRTEMEGIQWPW